MRHAEPTIRRAGLALAVIAALFLVAHVIALPATLEDLDSINFALGVRDFDIAKHQPHPPGFPIYIALAKISTPLFAAAGVAGAASRGLAIWGVLGAAFAAFPLFAFYRRLEGRDHLALFATLVTLTAPLFWFTANRPLSDMTGLAGALFAQAAALIAWRRQRDPAVPAADVRRAVALAAVLAGLVTGIRVQAGVLALPLLGLVIFDRRLPAERRTTVPALLLLTGSVLLWAIPLLAASGGLSGYLASLSAQGTEDFSEATMLWTRPSARVLIAALANTVVLPWATVPLAATVLTMAAVGAAVLVWRSREAFLLILLSVLPYLLFTLLFQEVAHGKYALPMIPATAYLAVVGIAGIATAIGRGIRPLDGKIAIAAVSLVIVASLRVAGPALHQYGVAPSPLHQAIADMNARARETSVRPVVIAHRDSKRALEWPDVSLPGPLLPTERGHESQAAVKYWLEGGRDPVWFLARPVRTDLLLIDPAHRQLAGQYRRPFDAGVFTGAARPNSIDWYEIVSPQWFLDRGWSLTPELAGVTRRDGLGPHLRPTLGYIARRPDEVLLMIGGVIGEGTVPREGDPPVHVRVTIDDRPILEWNQTARWFLRMVTIPAGTLAGDGGFSRLAVQTSNAGAPVAVKLEQFDLQPVTALVWGFDDGWMEMEFDPAKEMSWRWSGRTSPFRIYNAGRDVTIRLRGDSPMKYFDTPPRVKLTAGDRVLAEFSPSREFEQEILVPADALAAADGRVVLETDKTFQPPGDPRQLGLRLFEISVR